MKRKVIFSDKSHLDRKILYCKKDVILTSKCHPELVEGSINTSSVTP